MVNTTLKNDIQLYSKGLSEALMKVSDNKLSKSVADKIAERYASQIDYSDSMLMHVGFTTVASNLVSKIKSEYFTV